VSKFVIEFTIQWTQRLQSEALVPKFPRFTRSQIAFGDGYAQYAELRLSDFGTQAQLEAGLV